MHYTVAELGRYVFRALIIAVSKPETAMAMLAVGSALKKPLHVIGAAILVAIGFTLYADVAFQLPPALTAVNVQVAFVIFGAFGGIVWGFVGWGIVVLWRRLNQEKIAASK